MAKCPKCHKRFRVMDDEMPESHGCPYCNYNVPDLSNAKKCAECGLTAWDIDDDIENEDDVMEHDLEGETYCAVCAEEHGVWECPTCNDEGEVQALCQSPIALEPRMERCPDCRGSKIRGGC